MSDKTLNNQTESTRPEPTKTTDLEMKILEVGPLKYRIDMRQNGKSRFISVSEGTLALPRQGRIVIPMSECGSFCEKIYEVLKFANVYTPKNLSERKSQRERIQYAHSLTVKTPGGRKYYMDIIDAELTLTLRISYLFGDRRDSIQIIAEALPKFVEIIEGYMQTYPSIHPSDDYPAPIRRRGGYMRGNYGRKQRPYNGGGRAYGRRQYRSPRGGAAQYNGKHSSKEPVDGKRATSLKVLTDPVPTNITHNAKRFTFEIVEGSNTFLRITEIINDLRKSTLHVPVEVLGQMQSCIGDMSKKYSSVLQKSSQSAKQ